MSGKVKTVKKQDIAVELSGKLDIPIKEAVEQVDNFLTQVKQALFEGQNVKLSGFGNFVLRDKNPRPGCKPGKLGEKVIEQIPVEARRVVTFHAGSKLKTDVDSSSSL